MENVLHYTQWVHYIAWEVILRLNRMKTEHLLWCEINLNGDSFQQMLSEKLHNLWRVIEKIVEKREAYKLRLCFHKVQFELL